MRTLEETIGIKVPGQRYQLATVRVRATDSDEDILKRLSRIVGTVFNVTGTRYELLSFEPYKLKKLGGSNDRATTVDDPVEASVEPVKTPKAPKIKTSTETQVEPTKTSETIAVTTKDVKSSDPKVGETWKTKDKRRSTTFKIAAIEGDYAITNESRRIQLSRFCRYERVDLTS